MKSLLLTLACVFTTSSLLFSQEKIEEYANSVTQDTFSISLSKDEKSGYTIYFDAYSLDKIWEKGGFYVTEKNHEEFIKSLTESKNKFIEWDSVATANKVTELDKKVKTNCIITGTFYTSSWHFHRNLTPTFNFKITQSSDGTAMKMLVLRTGKLQSSSNQFTDHDGFVIAFSSADEIQDFINLVSIENIKKHVEDTGKKDDLFKD